MSRSLRSVATVVVRGEHVPQLLLLGLLQGSQLLLELADVLGYLAGHVDPLRWKDLGRGKD